MTTKIPAGWALVPREFVTGFCTLAHNWSLKAESPVYYHGVERDAFAAAYRECGQALAKLRPMLDLPTPPVDAVLGEPKINAAGDWRPVRDALESAYAQLGRTRGADGYPQVDWNLAVLMYEAAAAKRDTTPCIHCSKRIAWADAFRCLDCKGVMCERCAPEHFGPKHSDRASAAHPSAPADAVSTSGFIQTVQPDPTKLKWDEQNEQRGAIYREDNHG